MMCKYCSMKDFVTIERTQVCTTFSKGVKVFLCRSQT